MQVPCRPAGDLRLFEISRLWSCHGGSRLSRPPGLCYLSPGTWTLFFCPLTSDSWLRLVTRHLFSLAAGFTESDTHCK